MLNRLRHFSYCDEQNTRNVQMSSELLPTYLWGDTERGGDDGEHICVPRAASDLAWAVSDAQARAQRVESLD